jgi:hypothetical protein
VNHKPIPCLRAYRPTFFCLPPYHALHHVSPDAHFSSWIKLFDQVTGNGVSFEGRRVALSGAATPFGAAMQELLRSRGVEPIASLEAGGAGDLREVDILILADGETQQRCDESVAAIERFKQTARDRQLPVEVWAVGAPGGRFERHARRYYVDDRVIYRHIALAPSVSNRDLGLERAARVAFFFIRRGFNYVPAAPSGTALLAFAAFRYFLRPAPAPAGFSGARTSAAVSRGTS